ncbi:serine/arginine repetitive matrix protein 1-like [Saccostrea cucullata]|uniref:serine/arginine repetitive matrix protein 1-like n=1 Tax=Saccostrea cuccullata TaxID=36930 RepID=UPI002ED515B7
MKRFMIWSLFTLFKLVRGQMLPPFFFPPSFVRHEFPEGINIPGVDPSCPPPIHCRLIRDPNCIQPQFSMINGRRCPVCPRNRCTDPSSPTRQREENTASSNAARDGRVQENNDQRTPEQNRRSSSSTSTSSSTRVVIGNERGVLIQVDPPRPGRRPSPGSRGNPENLTSRRPSGPSSSRSPGRPRGRPSRGPRRRRPSKRPQKPTKSPPKSQKKLPQVDNQKDAHILFPFDILNDNKVSKKKQENEQKSSNPLPKSNVLEKSDAVKPESPSVPSHGRRTERQTRPSIRLIFQGSQSEGNEQSNQNQRNTQIPNRVLPSGNNALTNRMPFIRFPFPFPGMQGSPFTRVVQRASQGSANNNMETGSANNNRQPLNQQIPFIHNMHPFMQMALLNRARFLNQNAANRPSSTVTPDAASNNAAQPTPLRNNNIPNLLPPFHLLNPAQNQNAATRFANNVPADQVSSSNSEPTVQTVNPDQQAGINRWLEQMTMPIQQSLGEPNSPPSSQVQPQENQNQWLNQMAQQVQQMLGGNGQPPNQQTPQVPAEVQAQFQQRLQQMALQQQQLLAGRQSANQVMPPGMTSNRIHPQIPNLNPFQNSALGGTSPTAPNVANQNNVGGADTQLTQWLENASQQIWQQLSGGTNFRTQPNPSPQLVANNPQQTVSNSPPANGGANQLTVDNWLNSMVQPIQQELSGSPGNIQAPPSGSDLAGSNWFNNMLNPIQQGLGGV